MTTNTALIFKALHFAATKHRHQKRKDEKASPYITHPIEVAELLASVGKASDTNILCAALLHDTIEDTGTTADELQREFGPEITRLVQEVTDDKSLPKQERKRLQIESASKKSHGAKLIKLADKIANVRNVIESPPPAWDDQRRREYVEWARKVVDQLRGANQELERMFDQLVENYVELPQGNI
jgi:GTP diphosphokinase / guanosine-3',5'-bis(diphosphate) 3'-diphosphatase